MNILLIVQNISFPFDKRVFKEAVSLKNAGYNVYVLSPISEIDKLKYEEIESIKVYRYKDFKSSGTIHGFLFEYLNSMLKIYIIALYMVLSKGIRIIHVANPPDFFWLLGLIVKLVGVKFIYDQHDLAPRMFSQKFNNKLLLNFLEYCEILSIKIADGVIVVNNTFKEFLLDKVKKKNVKVVFNGPKEDFVPISNEFLNDIYKDYKVILYVGLMSKSDNVEVIIDVANTLINFKGERNIKFILLGDGDVMQSIEKQISELNLKEYIELKGIVTHEIVKEYLYLADVCVAPDKPNGLNEYLTLVKILEYMKAGKPFVSFDLYETHKLAKGCGLFAVSTNDFSDKLQLLINNIELQNELGNKGSEIIKEYMWSNQEKELLDLYTKLTKN